MSICEVCGIPKDAGFFDASNILTAPTTLGQEQVLARYQLHRNYCGVLMSFAQFTNRLVGNQPEFVTEGYEWQIRCNGQPRDPYLKFGHIINPWGYGGFPVQLRLEEGCLVEFVIRNVGGNGLERVGGRITGRFWYNIDYGGTPNRL